VERLKRRSEFLRVAGARRKCAMPGLVLQVRRQDMAGGATRVGYTASRKVGGAVQRNRARRRLRAAAGQIIPQHAKAGFDLVLIARGATVKRPFRALLEDLKAALKRVGAWRGAGDATTPAPAAGG
jgi:ribonuclease P protein component